MSGVEETAALRIYEIKFTRTIVTARLSLLLARFLFLIARL